jgi:hypothetical protein
MIGNRRSEVLGDIEEEKDDDDGHDEEQLK